MSPLINTIVNSASNIVEVPAMIAAALVAFAARPNAKDRTKAKPGPVDKRTMKDIGIERGSITWMK